MPSDRPTPANPLLGAVDTVGLALILPPGAVEPGHPVARTQDVLRAALQTPGACVPQRATRAADDETTVGRGGVGSP